MNAFRILGAVALLAGIASCQKVITLDVSEAESQLVIESLVTDTVRPWTVRLTRSVRYDSTNTFPPVTGGQVFIRDATAGVTDTLPETAPGSYSTGSARTGMPGHSYELTVRVNGATYTAASAMPARVPFDSLYTETNGGFGGSFRLLYPVFTDPAGVANYYRFIISVNGKRANFDTRDDRLSDGRVNGRPVFPDDQDSIQVGDLLTVEMQCLDRAAWNYFRTFNQADGGGSAPANPLTNIQGGALGYFAAVTTQRRSVTAK